MELADRLETIDDLSDELKVLYREADEGDEEGGFILDIGIAAGKSNALTNERKLRKEYEKKALKLQKELAASKGKGDGDGKGKGDGDGKGKGDGEPPADNSKIESLERRLEEEKVKAKVTPLAFSLAKDTEQAKMLVEKLKDHVEVVGDATKIKGLEGVHTLKDLAAYAKKTWPFLVSKDSPSGGGANGGRGGGAAVDKKSLAKIKSPAARLTAARKLKKNK